MLCLLIAERIKGNAYRRKEAGRIFGSRLMAAFIVLLTQYEHVLLGQLSASLTYGIEK